MNNLKSNQILSSIDERLTNELVSIDTHNSDMSGFLSSISLNANQHTTKLTSIDTSLDNIETDVSEIKTDVDTLSKTKIMFNARLTDGSNNYLAKADYSGGNGIDFYWSNNLGSTAYINKYVFTYPEAQEPTETELYHSTSWESKIGALNSGETDYEAPYITVNDNKDYFQNKSSGGVKQTWVSNQCFVFQKDFNEAPIEIGVSRKFGHYINANINTADYDDNPVGIIEGYYYDS